MVCTTVRWNGSCHLKVNELVQIVKDFSNQLSKDICKACRSQQNNRYQLRLTKVLTFLKHCVFLEYWYYPFDTDGMKRRPYFKLSILVKIVSTKKIGIYWDWVWDSVKVWAFVKLLILSGLLILPFWYWWTETKTKL